VTFNLRAGDSEARLLRRSLADVIAFLYSMLQVASAVSESQSFDDYIN